MRGGRRSHVVTPAKIAIVAELRAQHATREEIARAIGCSVPTLVKFYGREPARPRTANRDAVPGLFADA